MGINVAGLGSLTAGARQQDDIILIVDKHDFTQGPTGTTKIISVANLFTNVIGAGTLSWAGAVTGSSFAGVGTSLTALNATNLTNGTVPSARMAGAYVGITGVGVLTGLVLSGGINAAATIATTGNITSGGGVAVGGALTGATTGNFSGVVTAQSFTGNGPLITNLAAANLTGTVPNGVMTGAYTGITGLGTLANLTVTNPIGGSITGNAATATALATARTINGTSFNGTANITVAAAAGTLTGATLAAGVTASSLTSVGTLGSLNVTNTATVGRLTTSDQRAGVGDGWSLTNNAGTNTYLQCSTSGTLTVGDRIFSGGLVNVTGDAAGHFFLNSIAAPGAPANGAIWFTGSALQMRIGGVTKTFTLT